MAATTTHAFRIHKFGGPEVLSWESIELPEPKPGQVRLKHTAIGMNLMEIGLRQGAYPGPPLPFVPGVEAAAVVEALGSGVTTVKVGDRVGYAGTPVGSYAERRNFPAERLFPIPDDIPDHIAAAVMVKGMTAEYLLRRSYPVRKGETMVIHAAAGGTGLLCCALGKHIGARVIGTVSSDEKAEVAKAHGCDHPIVYTRENFADRVLEITNGKGADVVYDSVGKDTFEESKRCLSRFGTLVLFGIASGMPEPLELMKQDIMTEHRFLRGSLYAQTAERGRMLEIAANTFEYVRTGIMKVDVLERLPLMDAPKGHAMVESRKTTGSLVYFP